ncbi:MAG: DNA translocase FtsK 4TM domain-containing protein [Candidatus Pacebacteria bacterium]|nr:DNA translocase FtsK 4TM domain-containing protein [Candidatus Paceibacterota bacterium]
MAKKKKGKDKKESGASFVNELKTETMQAVSAIVFLVAGILTALASFDKAGWVGERFYHYASKLFGIGYFLVPLICLILSYAFLRGMRQRFTVWKLIGGFLFLLSGLGLVDLIFTDEGGIIGHYVSSPLISLVDVYASAAILVALIAISLLITLEVGVTFDQLAFWRKDKEDEESEKGRKVGKEDDSDVDDMVEEAEKKLGGKDEKEEPAPVVPLPKKSDKKKKDDVEDDFDMIDSSRSMKPFTPPPLTLLEKDSGRPETGDIKANANIIKRTLQNFGISVEMDEIAIGPSVTRYALKPAEGVKLSRIVALNNDLSLSLAAHPIRIEAPIPGKSLVGIEIPNTSKTTVGLATLLGSDEFQRSDKPLLVSLGKSITGTSHFANLGKAPHMLIAGATGSGKSVTIHAIITSLLYRNSPEDLRFIMIDPKRVELTLYNKIPHLLTPVITDAKKAILALKWAGKEMSRRYDVLEKNSVRDIDSYHKSVLDPAIERAIAEAKKKGGKVEREKDENGKEKEFPETMPFIVIVIDELADIMQAYPRELESAIVRLAQMSRAVGIHLVLSTQRPSVNVITGLIKANIPSRVALQVASQIDSRTILDQPGAEKLLGAGDMLYLGAEMSKPVRLQSAFISEGEVKKVAKFLYDTYKDEIMSEINLSGPQSEPGQDAVFSANLDDEPLEDDDMYEDARLAVVSAGKASTSYLQRKLGVGYSRAAKLMDMLEERGVIGAANGSKPREVMGAAEAGQEDAADAPTDSGPIVE